MNIRLVAYRPNTTTDTVDTAFELELNEAPNISLNFQFSDIKEPETRKGSYSQTFKLPFTPKNDEFFQSWYNVNIDTLVFSTSKKFNAIIFVGSTPQFDGVLKLKAVYSKARQYEVVVMANSSDLFTEIGDKKVVDAIGSEFDHTFSYNNIKLSWDGSSTSFDNTSSVSLRDADAGVQKVMYPLTVSEVDTFYFPMASANGSGTHLNMNQATLNAISSDTEAAENSTSIEQLKPAVQIKAILKLIIANAGFSYSSDFIDGSYFGKIFMTTCNKVDSVVPPIVSGDPEVWASGSVSGEADWTGEQTAWPPSGTLLILGANEWVDVDSFAPTVAWSDPQGVIQSDGQTFEIKSPAQTMMAFSNFEPYNQFATEPSTFRARLIPVISGVPQYDSDGVLYAPDAEASWEQVGSGTEYIANLDTAMSGFVFNLAENGTPIVGTQYRLQVCVTEDVNTTGYQQTCTFGFNRNSGSNWQVDIISSWAPLTESVVGNTIDISACIDPDLTQKEFLKDILERFNMLVIVDPDNPTNLIIEPYVDYLKSGTIKDWTEKLDVSKEIVVKDTTALQKKVINLTDLEDVDLLNKITSEFNPSYNVWGKYYQTNTTNEFAIGELKNNPVFAPFRVESVYKDSSGSLNVQGPGNLAVHYVFSTETTSDGVVDVLKNTQPKLFYYRGSATNIQTLMSADDVSIFMHKIDSTTVPQTRTAYEFTQYPVCSAWDIDTGIASYVDTLTADNKCLFWGFAPPDNPDNDIFNFNGSVNWSANTLYGLYWSSYLNATYNEDARMMECYLNLNEVDIYSFKYNDEIFIKDSYWRILNIHNYQVGSKVSTKVVLLKAIDTLGPTGAAPIDLGSDCSYTPGTLSDGNNLWLGQFYVWCPAGTPGCTPDVAADPWTGSYTDASCCENLPNAQIDQQVPYEDVYSDNPSLDGLVVCQQVQGDGNNPSNMPAYSNNNTALSMLSKSGLTSYFKAKLNKNFIRGSADMKFSKLMIPQTADDLGIKYVSRFNNMPQVSGESHKLILLGTTTNIETTTSYIQGDSNNMSIPIPAQSNMMIQVMGISTVVSSSNATYGVGHTEQFVYYTAFRNVDETVTQIGTALGRGVVTNIESGSANSFLEITSADDTITGGKKLQINVKSTADNTTKVFTLDVNMTLQRINSFNYDTNWALWQNGQRIQLQNNEFLVWN